MYLRQLTLTVIVFLCGCALFQSGAEVAPVDGTHAPKISARTLAELDLASITEVFPADERVTVQAFDPTLQQNEAFLGGRYLLGDSGSITVRVYKSARDVDGAAVEFMEVADASFRLGEPDNDFLIDWWYDEGPPASVLYTYGNVLVCLRLQNVPPHKIGTTGLRAATAVARRIRKVAHNW